MVDDATADDAAVDGDPTFWTQRDAVRTYPWLAGVCGALFAALGRLAPALPTPDAVVAAATLSRQLGEDAARWTALVPESMLLEETRAEAGPAPRIDPELNSVLAAADALVGELEVVLARMSPVADAAARRVARSCLDDLTVGLASLRPAA